MRIVNAVNMHFLKVILKKYFLVNNLDYIFVDPEDNLSEIVEKSKPEIIIMEHNPLNKLLNRQILEFIDAKNINFPSAKLLMIVDIDTFDSVQDQRSGIQYIKSDVLFKELSQVVFKVTSHIESEQNALLSVEHKKTILFVDDDHFMHAVVGNAFENTPYQLIHAYNGMEGFKVFKAQLPSMVITDLEMPFMNGDDLCHLIKEDPIGIHVPVIILTGSQVAGSIEIAYNYGADDFLEKPLASESLINKVNEYFISRSIKRQEKILIVDDSKMIREILRHAVLKSGMTAITASDGVEGLELIRLEAPDVVITDINMPRMDGYEMVQAIRSNPETANQKIIMISTQSSPYDLKRGEELGIVRYFIKPFDVDKVMMEVEHILIENYRIYKKEYEYMLHTIHSLVIALEERDAYTKGHTDRVTDLSVQLATYMNLDAKEIEKIRIAANLHDIGKIGVRDAILLKPDKLTIDEYIKIQEHPIKGVEILKPIQSLQDILPLILLHHERWDGQGYPTAIHGNEIPIGARIITVSDSYDAMTSNRPYRTRLTHEQALTIIENQSGSQFCPVCAIKFVEMMTK